MVSQREGQLPENAAVPRWGKASLLGKVGWGMLGVAVALWGVSSLLLVNGASLRTGWSLLACFVVLIAVGLALLVTGGPIERSLLRWQLSHRGPTPSHADRAWEEHWEELIRRVVR